jgi:putative membrane protein
MKEFFQRWIINSIAVMAAAWMVSGIKADRWQNVVMAALVLGILNALIKPALTILSLPLVVLTLGLFMFVINALLLTMVGFFLQPGFQVEGFWPAFKGGIVISIVSWFLGVITGTSKAKITVSKGGTQKNQTHRNRIDKDDGGGPVIDV